MMNTSGGFMKFKFAAAAAAALLVVGGPSLAATVNEASFVDGTAFVYTFSASGLAAGQTFFSFVLDAVDTDFTTFFTPGGQYAVTGDISGSKYSISSVMLDGVAWSPTSGSDIDLGTKTVGPTSSLKVDVVGSKTGAGANFSGSLILTPVPEPETYAMMLAGLAAFGFLARRRQG
jgi:hypothetical protein